MSTIFGDSAIIVKLGKNTITPDMDYANTEFADADDELLEIAKFIQESSPYNESVDPYRIKFLYTSKSKKEGGRFAVGSLIVRPDHEKLINSNFDFIITLYHPVWKDLDSVNKVIQLDKLLCGINIDAKDDGSINFKKTSQDSREYTNSLRFFGAEKVINSSELVHQTASQYEERMREERKRAKAAKEDQGVDFKQYMREE